MPVLGFAALQPRTSDSVRDFEYLTWALKLELSISSYIPLAVTFRAQGRVVLNGTSIHASTFKVAFWSAVPMHASRSTSTILLFLHTHIRRKQFSLQVVLAAQ